MNLVGAIVSLLVGGAMATATVVGIVSNNVNSHAPEDQQADVTNPSVEYGSN